MKSIFVLAATFATFGLVQAQFSSLPECAIVCTDDAAVAVGCSAGDESCACATDTFLNDAINCVYSDCPMPDRQGSQITLRNTCANAPPPAASPSASGSSSAGSAPTSSSSSGDSSASDTPSTTPTEESADTPDDASPTPAPAPPGGTQTSPGAALQGDDDDSTSTRMTRSFSSASRASTTVVVQTIGAGEDETGLLGAAGAVGVSKVGYFAAVVAGVVGAGFLI
ncbi:hypothetical protein CC1G_09629 [Coprinopsis cinerea okayama7|uniref:CFEM domain-containing protein n=1 Tax=Coprinopsis cinerea (strain Okayama-7 / 130 / ATCC MYA-4618 / FGSC 9003) TaxID=240176 RepID=A8N4E5_COPC7|nr:hypothetical protein CC1G_09629 [Coprinopsis cinerea okayama7\|eukprot:XP_001829740.1 hypothetical protein CC1G_09629 [Coprinopsis cinerea okayama7\